MKRFSRKLVVRKLWDFPSTKKKNSTANFVSGRAPKNRELEVAPFSLFINRKLFLYRTGDPRKLKLKKDEKNGGK